jgi:hypothetical protein
MKTFLQSLSGAALVLALASARTAPSVSNAGFETGDFSGWTLSGDADHNLVASDLPYDGSYGAVFGQSGSAAILSQTLATDAGHSYIVSFWLANLGGSVNNSSTINSVEVLSNDHSIWLFQDKTASDYTKYSVQFTADSASTVLAFKLRHDETFWLLDNVAVVPSIPEPASWLMLGAGLGLLALQRRRS